MGLGKFRYMITLDTLHFSRSLIDKVILFRQGKYRYQIQVSPRLSWGKSLKSITKTSYLFHGELMVS